jgi:hypothetical protein
LRPSRLAAALLLAGAVLAAPAMAAGTAEQAPGTTEPDILVIGTRYISGIQPERDLDEEAIASYDASTIDGLLAEVQAELGEDSQPPLILVNGERVSSLDDIGGLPVEALLNVKVLPHGSAVAAGGTSTQRLISLTLARKLRAATLLAAHKIATDGDWNGDRGEAMLTYLQGATRANLTFRGRDEDSLFESERDIIQPGALADLGRFRTLRPDSRSDDLSGNFATRLAPWLTSSATLRFNRSNRLSARGLPSPLSLLPADPLRTRSRHSGGEGIVSLNGTFGLWNSHFAARYSQSKDETFTQRSSAFALAPISTDRATARTTASSALLSFSGPAVKLPAGDLQATLEGEFLDNRLHSTSNVSGPADKRTFNRPQWSLRGAIEAPLVSGPAVGDVSATAEAGIKHYSDAGTLDDYALGLTWEPLPVLRFRAEFERTKEPASIQSLGNPVVVTSGVRVFDPLTGETVDVTEITGGNPDLRPEESRVWRLSGQWTLVKRLNLKLNGEYTDAEERNFVSSVPDASTAVMLAFPERFIRDSSGTLTAIDLRPVNFDSHREKRLRYGFSLHTNLGAGGPALGATTVPADEDPPAANAAAVQAGPSSPPLRLQLNANHSIVFEDEITIRPGLGSVDLLEGGAIGIGGGRVRHQLDGTAALTSGGLGLRLGVNWRGKYTLDSRIGSISDTLRFSPVLAVTLRAFADMRRFLPEEHWAQGLRLSLNVQNLTNDRQEVRDSAGNTPLQFQPGYRDPLGRTVELELRKVF